MREVRHLRLSIGVGHAIAVPVAFCLMAGLVLMGPSSSGASLAGTAATIRALGATTGCMKGTAPGVSATTIQMAVTLVDLSGGSVNDASVGLPSPQEQEQYWNMVAANLNKSGGIGCRKIQLKFYEVNSFDVAGAEQTCQTIASSHPFVVLDVGALSAISASDCIPTAKVPFASSYLTPDELTKYYPYYLSVGGLETDSLRTGILALKQLGYFTAAKGFKKLGVLSETCIPALNTSVTAALKQAGVATNKIVQFSLGCPSGGFTPASLAQAVLLFKTDGVTDVTSSGANSAAAEFSTEAATQHYKPKYILNTDELGIGTPTGIAAGTPANLNGAVNIETQAYGEQTTPNYKPSGGTKKCDAIFAPVKETVYTQLDGYGGIACDYLWFIQALVKHATSLQPAKLAAAMHTIGTVELSYPIAPTDYAAAPKDSPYGIAYWRAETYLASCKCWHVPNPKWNPPFK
jgi:hypothetical protein